MNRRRPRHAALRASLALAVVSAFGGSAVALAAVPAPTGVTAKSPTNAAPVVKWNAVTSATKYRVFRDGTFLGATSLRTWTDTTLVRSGTYGYTVRAVVGGAVSPASASARVVYDITPPTVPGGVTAAESPTASAPVIAWTASTDGLTGVPRYRVYRDGALVAEPARSPFVDAALSVAGTYAYTVAAVDGAGNASARSSPVSVTYEAAPPPPPGGTGYTGVSSRLVQPVATAGEKTEHPELKLVSIMLRWRAVETADGTFSWGALDESLEDAAARGYKVVVRILAGADAPDWLYADAEHPVTRMTLLASDATSSYKGEISVPLPWDPDLEIHYRDLLRALDAHLRVGDGSGGILREEVFFVPIAMPTVHGSEMAVGYGTGTYTGVYKGVQGTYDRAAVNRAEWRSFASSGTTDAERDAAIRRDLEEAWRRAIDAHMQELTIVPSAIAYGPLFSDTYAAAKAIASSKVAEYPTRLWSMTTNLQPKVFSDGSLGPYSAWSANADRAIRNAIAAGGRIGFQTAGSGIIDTAAKMAATIDDGIDAYGARFLEVAPEMVDRYAGMLLSDPGNAQARMEAIYGG